MYAPSVIRFTRVNRRCLILLDVLISSSKNTDSNFPVCMQQSIRKAPQKGAFFVSVIVVFCFTFECLWARDCQTQTIEQSAEVEYVYDGDSLLLKDGRRIRIIGIDTPELGRNGIASEPYAEKAPIKA